MPALHPDDFGATAREEGDLVRGRGTYVDDSRFAGELHGIVLRSPHAHARIRSIDATRALAEPGVQAVITGTELSRSVDPLPCAVPLAQFGGPDRAHADRAILATDRARHVGDGVAFVVADRCETAERAAALVDVDYEELEAHVDPTASSASEAIWPQAPDNVCFTWRFGDSKACGELFARAAHVVELRLEIPRIVVNPIEPRSAIGLHEPETDTLTLISNTQGVHFVRGVLATSLRRDPQSLRVLTPNVGGGFGSKIYAYPEHALVLHAARQLGRPVRWTATRSEAILADTQGRGHVTTAALALDENGRFLAISVRPTVDLGAYLSQLTPATATVVGAPVQAGAYHFEAIEIVGRGVFTNKVPVDAFRGAGRPEATYVLERLIDRAADVLDIDPADLRARNLPGSRTEDLVTATGLVVVGGRFLDNQSRCLEAADRARFEARRAESLERGMLRGFGFANYLEANGGLQIAEVVKAGSHPVESARLTLSPDGSLDVIIGTQSTGQDHARPMVKRAAERLGIDPSRVIVREGDSAALPLGAGTGGSKSLLTSSVALEASIAALVARATSVLSGIWNVPEEGIEFDAGVFSAVDADRRTTVAELAVDYAAALSGEAHSPLLRGSSANGCHACEVEIDRETGAVSVVRYTAVDDFGTVIDEATVRGQVAGGVAQGFGQALNESAQPVTELPGILAGAPFHPPVARSTQFPRIDWHDNGLPSSTNVFGAKACGESGAAAAPPTIMNAVVDALSSFSGVENVQMPARPADLWRIVHAGS